MTQEDRYFKFSGRFGPLGLISMALLGGATAIALGLIYGIISFYNPFIYVNFILTFLLGLATGWMVAFGARVGKVRNVKVFLRLGVLAGLVAVYANWVGWIFAISEWELLVFHPGHMATIMRKLAKIGVWEIFGWTPTGAVLYLLWIIEAVFIIGSAVFLAVGASVLKPFCERCEQWVISTRLKPYSPVTDPVTLIEQLEEGNYEELSSFKKLPRSSKQYTDFELMSCPICNDFHLLTVRAVMEVVESKKKTEKKEVEILRDLIVDASVPQLIRGLPAAAQQEFVMPADETTQTP